MQTNTEKSFENLPPLEKVFLTIEISSKAIFYSDFATLVNYNCAVMTS